MKPLDEFCTITLSQIRDHYFLRSVKNKPKEEIVNYLEAQLYPYFCCLMFAVVYFLVLFLVHISFTTQDELSCKLSFLKKREIILRELFPMFLVHQLNFS